MNKIELTLTKRKVEVKRYTEIQRIKKGLKIEYYNRLDSNIIGEGTVIIKDKDYYIDWDDIAIPTKIDLNNKHFTNEILPYIGFK